MIFEDVIHPVNDRGALRFALRGFKMVKKSSVAYFNIPSAFDIETSSFYYKGEKCAIMYAWAFSLNGVVFAGRTWDEFHAFLHDIEKLIKYDIYNRFVIYVHNLSYEFQFIRKRFTWEKVFSIKERKPCTALTTSGLEFRCSYYQSGKSLESIGESIYTKYGIKKEVGALDYDLLRHSNTTLTDREWLYIRRDVDVLCAYVYDTMMKDGGIHKIKQTKTGYVRDYMRKKTIYGENRYNYTKKIKHLKMCELEYRMLLEAFAGGFTHANPWIVGDVIND